MAVAPHALASQAALSVLREGGNAIEAMVAAAATIAVVYPHMNGIGGDCFWTVAMPGQAPLCIEAAGPAARAVSREFYRERGLAAIPVRGPLSANTVAATVSGWDAALACSAEIGGKMPLARLLEDAIHYANQGIPVTCSQAGNTASKFDELAVHAGFRDTFGLEGRPPREGEIFRQPKLGATLQRLAWDGLDSFYRGDLARDIAADLASVGSPVALADLQAYRARRVTPLHLPHSTGDLYNMQPPTQGLVSLIILALLDRLDLKSHAPDSVEHVHLVVEATKQAFLIRDRYISDPDYMKVDPQSCLTDAFLAPYLAAIRLDRALPWGQGKGPADTIWMGVIDGQGRAVSFIQSIYHEFGSGLVLPATGINWQNRGCSFSLDPAHINTLEPGKKPFHTLNPALARFGDGRTMVYGSMGGDGQPQTQAALFTRIGVFGQHPQQAISAPRWLLGRTWGQSSDSLKLESRFAPEIVAGLRALGHEVEMLPDFDESVGHAGAIVHHANGTFEGGADPRSNGGVAGF
ncbi:MAG TPA: gamma-glutamyltransferase family protein [Janthinobacterium sp.]|jgi:gamma-glutamyltranspeptidase/glutathione hydrolase|nr:gamma-glutamyltransferase family protein [Janthinobacterium sp.]